MASNPEFVEYACEQMSGAGEITYKKMFGEYGVYCNGKIVGLICDNKLYIKKTEAGSAVIPDCAEASPYAGAKPHMLIEETDDRELLSRLVAAACKELPEPKPRKKKA